MIEEWIEEETQEEKIEEVIVQDLKVQSILLCFFWYFGIIAFFVTTKIYNKNLGKLYEDLEGPEIGESIIDNSGLEEASSQIGKTVEEQMDELMKTNAENEEATQVSTNENSLEGNDSNNETPVNTENKKETKKEEQSTENTNVKDPSFTVPVEGEMMKEYAKDKLVYSETLKEWTQHTGVDIKAEKTTIVKASEAGKVTAIKNDPRYGITVIIEHVNGYETRYANLLTAEFVSIGEEVTIGQTIGTVGNTGAFEVLDDCHLHFEILKDGEYLDPQVFIEI